MSKQPLVVTIEEAVELINSQYTKLPAAMEELTLGGNVQVGRRYGVTDRKQQIKNAFLLGHGQAIIQELLRFKEDALRWRALLELSGEYIDTKEGKDPLDKYWEFKPAGYDGCSAARYWMGTQEGSLTEIVDAARKNISK